MTIGECFPFSAHLLVWERTGQSHCQGVQAPVRGGVVLRPSGTLGDGAGGLQLGPEEPGALGRWAGSLCSEARPNE